MEDTSGFNVLFGVAQGIGILNVILVLIWTSHYRGGFSGRSQPRLEFNWHPLLMTIGFVYLFANSIMIYRALRNMRKQKLKLIHAGIHTAVVLCVICAQIAVFDSHNYNDPPIPNLYSLHSWIGLLAILIYVGQWFGSILIFLYPGAALSLRAKVLPFHVYGGLVAFVLVLAAVMTGLLEKAIFTFGNSYGDLPGEAVLMNFIGIFFIIFGILVVYITTEAKYKRYPRPEDGALLTTPE